MSPLLTTAASEKNSRRARTRYYPGSKPSRLFLIHNRHTQKSGRRRRFELHTRPALLLLCSTHQGAQPCRYWLYCCHAAAVVPRCPACGSNRARKTTAPAGCPPARRLQAAQLYCSLSLSLRPPVRFEDSQTDHTLTAPATLTPSRCQTRVKNACPLSSSPAQSSASYHPPYHLICSAASRVLLCSSPYAAL